MITVTFDYICDFEGCAVRETKIFPRRSVFDRPECPYKPAWWRAVDGALYCPNHEVKVEDKPPGWSKPAAP